MAKIKIEIDEADARELVDTYVIQGTDFKSKILTIVANQCKDQLKEKEPNIGAVVAFVLQNDAKELFAFRRDDGWLITEGCTYTWDDILRLRDQNIAIVEYTLYVND